MQIEEKKRSTIENPLRNFSGRFCHEQALAAVEGKLLKLFANLFIGLLAYLCMKSVL